ncbi:MAG: DinB family protein [Anaerolineae bacterium]
MKIDIHSIKNSPIRVLYSLWWPQHQILRDFAAYLTEEQLDYRMVDSPSRKADTPRESLAHILYVQLVYLNAVKTGTLDFKDMGVEHYRTFTKERLLDEWERIDQEMFTYLTADTFDSQCQVEVPWGGKMNAVDLLFFLRDHDILHIGWNLAVMDHLDIPRFDSLVQYWGP